VLSEFPRDLNRQRAAHEALDVSLWGRADKRCRSLLGVSGGHYNFAMDPTNTPETNKGLLKHNVMGARQRLKEIDQPIPDVIGPEGGRARA